MHIFPLFHVNSNSSFFFLFSYFRCTFSLFSSVYIFFFALASFFLSLFSYFIIFFLFFSFLLSLNSLPSSSFFKRQSESHIMQFSSLQETSFFCRKVCFAEAYCIYWRGADGLKDPGLNPGISSYAGVTWGEISKRHETPPTPPPPSPQTLQPTNLHRSHLYSMLNFSYTVMP